MLNVAFFLLFLFQQTDMIQVSVAGRQQCVGDVCTATGDVVLTYQDIRIEADSVTWNQDTYDISAGERVKFTRGDERLEGERLELNARSKVGTMRHVRGYVGPGYYFTAEEVHRHEDGRYELNNATLTTCDADKPGWSFQFKKRAIVTPGRSVTANGSIFRLEGVPLIYLPYVVVPTTNRDRSTGFLIPSTSTSTAKGRSVSDSFYYAINRSSDAMFTGEYFTKRGPAGEVLFRAVANQDSRLEVSSFFVHDKLGQGGQSARIFNYTNFGNGFRGVADMNLVSSFLFRQVFEEGFSLISSPIEHSLAYLTRNEPGYSYNFVYNRTGIFFSDQPTAITRKLPAFEAAVPERQLGSLPAYLSFATGVSALSRRDASIRTPGFVGRFDAYPVLEIPIVRSSAFEWSHDIGVRQTFYSKTKPEATGPTGQLNRFVFDYSMHATGPQLERDFGSWRHVIEPTLDYHYVDGVERFRDTIVVDSVDLLADTNQVEYGITNRFFTSREIFSWRISQEYFFDPTFGGAIVPGQRNQFAPTMDLTGFAYADGVRRFSPVVSSMRLSTSENTSTDLQVDYDTERHRFESAGISGGVNRGASFGNISYFFRRSSPIQFPSNQLRANAGYGNDQKTGLSFALSMAYDVQRSLFQESVSQVGYNFDCYGLSLEWMQFKLGARIESRIRFSFSLKNIGTFGNIRRQDRIF
jgi:LPS-assembly protein